MFEMIDEQSNRVKFVGNEKECLEFSMANPNCQFIMNDLNKDKKGKNNESIQSDSKDN